MVLLCVFSICSNSEDVSSSPLADASISHHDARGEEVILLREPMMTCLSGGYSM
jgi:hypothetical protein